MISIKCGTIHTSHLKGKLPDFETDLRSWGQINLESFSEDEENYSPKYRPSGCIWGFFYQK